MSAIVELSPGKVKLFDTPPFRSGQLLRLRSIDPGRAPDQSPAEGAGAGHEPHRPPIPESVLPQPVSLMAGPARPHPAHQRPPGGAGAVLRRRPRPGAAGAPAVAMAPPTPGAPPSELPRSQEGAAPPRPSGGSPT